MPNKAGRILTGIGVGMTGVSDVMDRYGQAMQRKEEYALKKQEMDLKIKDLKMGMAANNVTKVLSQPAKYRKLLIDKSSTFRNNLSLTLGYDNGIPETEWEVIREAYKDDQAAKDALQIYQAGIKGALNKEQLDIISKRSKEAMEAGDSAMYMLSLKEGVEMAQAVGKQDVGIRKTEQDIKTGKSEARLRDAQAWEIYNTEKPVKLSKTQEYLDRYFVKDYNEYVLSGKFSDSVKQLEQLDEAAKLLDKSWGGATGWITGAFPDFLRKRMPGMIKGYKAEQMVKEVVQRSLRPILGAQFTEKEGQMLMDRAFDPSLDEKTNIKRILRLAKQLRTMAAAKQKAIDYYEAEGTMAGFKGQLPDVKSTMTQQEEPEVSESQVEKPKIDKDILELDKILMKRGNL